MDGMLNPAPGLMIWTIIVFILLTVLLAKFAFPIILNALKAREEGIANSIKNAEDANKKAEEILIQSQKKFDNAQSEINILISNGKKQAESIIVKATQEAELVKKNKIDNAIKEIERSKQDAISSLRREVASLVIEATGKLLNEKLDKDKHQSLVESYIDKLPKN